MRSIVCGKQTKKNVLILRVVLFQNLLNMFFLGGWVPLRLGPLVTGMWVGARGKRRMPNPPTLANERNPVPRRFSEADR